MFEEIKGKVQNVGWVEIARPITLLFSSENNEQRLIRNAKFDYKLLERFSTWKN